MPLNARMLALGAMSRLRREGDASFTRCLESITAQQDADPRNTALAERIFIGCYQWASWLDALLRPHCRGKYDTLHPLLRDILRMGAFQILYLDRVPVSAAVNESVALARKKLNPGAAGVANAVLRRFSEAAERGVEPPLPPDPVEALAIRSGHPAWFVRRLRERLDDAETRRFLELDNQPPQITVQVNTLRCSVEEVMSAFSGADPHPVQGISGCFSVSELTPEGRASLQRGDCFVQDLSARMAVLAADPRPGTLVLDICAAPGGKSFSSAMAMAGKGRVFAGDLSEKRLQRMRENCRRLGLEDLIAFRCGDAAQPETWADVTADLVLVDAPCSGFGTIRKKPEIRAKDPQELAALPPMQLSILTAAAKRVRRGGVLLYSTCTIFPEENEEVVRRFLAGNASFAAEDFELPAPFGPSRDGMLTVWPHLAESDGFYIAKMRKRDD